MSRNLSAIKSEYKKVSCERNAFSNEVGVLRLKLEQFNSGEKLFGYENFSKFLKDYQQNINNLRKC